MEIVYGEAVLADYIERNAEVSPDHPVLIDRFLDDAIEIDVDAIYDGEELYLGGVMEHIEEAGIQSGDSDCALHSSTQCSDDIERVLYSTAGIACGIRVRGLLNGMYAVASGVVCELAANPRATRIVPIGCKPPSVPLAKAAAWVML